MGAKGYCFPWESATTGEDVTPDTCRQCRDQQIFVSGAISFAIRQYLSVTNDRDFMTRNDFDGCGMSFKIAEFYQSIARYNHSKARYDISRKYDVPWDTQNTMSCHDVLSRPVVLGGVFMTSFYLCPSGWLFSTNEIVLRDINRQLK